MKAKEDLSTVTMGSSDERIKYLLGALLKRRIITAALTLGYWTMVLVWSFFK